MTKNVMHDLLQTCKEMLDDKYDLVYVHYDDKLMAEQVGFVVAGEWEALWESNTDWEFENRSAGSRYHAQEALTNAIDKWEKRDGKDYTALKDEFEFTDEWDELIREIEERDESDPWGELASHTGTVLMRQVIANEDVALYGNHSPTAVHRWLLENAEPGTSFKRSKYNMDVIRSVIGESMHSLAYSMGMLVYAADVGDLYKMGDVEYVDIVNPYLYIGNYYQGDGWCSEKPLEATFRVKRKDLRTDASAPGYGWDEVAGVVTSAYEAEIRPVKDGTTKEMIA